MTGLACVTLWAPLGSLIRAGVKTIETRPRPPPGDMCPAGVRPQPGVRINRGDRIGIHQGKRWQPGWRRQWVDPDATGPEIDRYTVAVERLGWEPYEDVNGSMYWQADPRGREPLGAIVATATVADALPILGADGKRPQGVHSAIWEYDTEGDLPHQQGGLRLIGLAEGAPRCIEDQRPYGIWTPGRWAWLLDDVQPTTVRCPRCWGYGELRCPRHVVIDEACLSCMGGVTCPVCREDGHCDPIPARGREGVWRWTPEADRG